MSKQKREPFDPWLIPPSPPEEIAAPAVQSPLTVSQLTASIKQAITRHLPPTVYVVGQISNLKRHTSGHLYFTLKDAHSELPCVMWRTDAMRLKFKPSDGLEVLATGGIEVFDRAGRYQMYVRRIEPRGVGSLELAFRQLYERLEKEGLFDAQRKKTSPKYPRRIGVVTSPTGAAVADILRTLNSRYACVHVLVFPVRVQGAGAAAEIAAAIASLNAHAAALGGIDVLIVGRGGGSLEDLWAFNEEPVARAIFASTIPVISGVGHEVDTTIADLVADVRAATPTAAAQLAVPVLEDVLGGLIATQTRLGRGVRVRREMAESRLDAFSKRSLIRDPLSLVRGRFQSVELLKHEVHRNQVQWHHANRTRLDRTERILQRIAPHKFLADLANRLSRMDRTLRESIWKKLSTRLRAAEAGLRRMERSSPSQRIPAMRQRLSQAGRQLGAAETRRVAELAARLKSAAGLLQAVSHRSVLERGFSITRRADGGQLIRSIADAKLNLRIVTQVQDGEFESKVDS